MWLNLLYCVVPEDIHTTPAEGIGFSMGNGGGVNLPIFQWGRGVHQREIFPEDSCNA